MHNFNVISTDGKIAVEQTPGNEIESTFIIKELGCEDQYISRPRSGGDSPYDIAVEYNETKSWV